MNGTLAGAIVVLTNVPDETVATKIAHALVNERLAACVNILARCNSLYWWGGMVERGEEVPLVIKTTTERYPEVEARIKALHPYTVPEIIAMPIVSGAADYLAWVASETTRPVRA